MAVRYKDHLKLVFIQTRYLKPILAFVSCLLLKFNYVESGSIVRHLYNNFETEGTLEVGNLQ